MKKLLALLVLLTVFAAGAENSVHHSDVQWVTVPDSPTWIYDCGRDARINLMLLHFGMPVDGVAVEYELANDLMDPDARGTVVLRNGCAEIPVGTMRNPGFRDCRLTASIDGQTYKHHVKVGFSPDQIAPYTQKPADFDRFWSDNLTQLAQVPLKYTQTFSERLSTDDVDVYLVKLTVSKLGQAVYGYLYIPRNATARSCPISFCPPGAGIKTIKEQDAHLKYARKGFIRFAIDIHGINPEMPQEQFDEVSRAFNSRENGYLTNNLSDRDNYYMKHVYLALVRSIDFLTSLPEWDGRNVVIQGGSQGGALAIIGAALDNRVTACVANHPALADMAGYRMNRADGYPHFSKMNNQTTPQNEATMAYYDAVNFARNLRVPLYMTWGFNDNTCPPTTSYALWNVVSAPKEALITPINEHWTTDATTDRQIAWALARVNGSSVVTNSSNIAANGTNGNAQGEFRLNGHAGTGTGTGTINLTNPADPANVYGPTSGTQAQSNGFYQNNGYNQNNPSNVYGPASNNGNAAPAAPATPATPAAPAVNNPANSNGTNPANTGNTVKSGNYTGRDAKNANNTVGGLESFSF